MKRCLSRYYIFFCCLFLFVAQFVSAAEESRQDQFQDAVSSYSQGDYQAAIKSFESLLKDEISAPLFYNLANSYAQSSQSGRAILNYERALRLNPSDSDIRGNLELLRRDQGLFQEEQSITQRFVSFLGLNQWLAIASGSFLLFAIILLLPATIISKQTSRYSFAAVCLLLTILSGSGAAGQYQHWHDGVVVAEDARIRVSPFESAASIGTIQQGRLVQPGKVHNDYVLIVDEAGRSGWLKSDSFEAIATLVVSR